MQPSKPHTATTANIQNSTKETQEEEPKQRTGNGLNATQSP